jgi:tetratricopeptide (TPR) repeat protein
MAIHQANSTLYFVLSDFASSRAEAERLLSLARQAGDRVSEGAALAGIAWASLWAYDFDRALDCSRQAIEVAEQANAKPVVAGGHFITGFVYATTGRLDEAKRKFDESLRVSAPIGDVLHQSLALQFAGHLRNWEGDYAEALRLESEGLRIVREHNLLVPLLFGLFFLGIAKTGRGDHDGALTTLEEGLVLSEKVGDEVMRLRFLNCLGWLHIECGDVDTAFTLNRDGAEGARKRGDPETTANAEINLGDICLAKGDLTLAQEFLEGVHRLVKDPATSEWMKWRYSTHLFASLGDLWLARGDHTKAREFADQCLELATRTNSRKNLVKGWRLRGEIALVRRQWDEAEPALREALTFAQAIGNPTQLWKTYAALGRLYAETKKPDVARQTYQAARQVIDGIKANLQNPGLRASLENAPQIRRLYELSVQ